MPRACTRTGFATVAIGVSVALGGGGPENVLIIADPTDPVSMHAANYYRDARGVPSANILYMDPDAQNYVQFVSTNLTALTGELSQRVLDDHIDYILVMPGGQYRVSAVGFISDPCSGISWFSIGSCYSSAFIADDILAGGMRHNESNRYFGSFVDAPAFDSSFSYLGGSPSESGSARRYFIGSALGFIGPLGNTLEELFDMVDRSVASDGTHPSGTFYYMNNAADPSRNVRQPQFNNAVSSLASLGATGEVISGALPSGRHDCLGIMSGFATQNLPDAEFTILPGAFCEQLTSFAAVFDPSTQTKASEWIRKGASGSYGAVQEPCNYLGKFPRAKFHQVYAEGMTLGEAAFRSLGFFPYQGLIYGDPLTRPFAHIPSVTLPGAPVGPVSGVITLSPQATTTHSTAEIVSFELLVDAVSMGVEAFGSDFEIDTTELREGHHDVRILAFDDSPARTVGHWVGSIDVDNSAHDASIAVDLPTGNLATPFQFTVSAAGGTVSEVRLWQNGRVIGSSGSAGAPITIHGRLLGAGPADVLGEVLFDDGIAALTAPVSLDVVDVEGAVLGAPTAYSYGRTISRDDPALIELPSTFSDDLSTASWQVSATPAQASLLNTTGPYRVLIPDSDAEGSDTLQFSVTTPSGASATATITISYEASEPCPADLTAPFGTLDFSDVLAFLVAFSTGSPQADLALPMGVFDFSDVLAYLGAFAAGCP